MDKRADQEKKERTGVNLRVNEADKLYFDIWYRGEHDRKYTGLPDTTKNRERCEKVKELILREMELVVFALSASTLPNTFRMFGNDASEYPRLSRRIGRSGSSARASGTSTSGLRAKQKRRSTSGT